MAACFSKMPSCGPLLTVGNISGPLYADETTVYLKEQSPFFSTPSALLRLSIQAAALTPCMCFGFYCNAGGKT